ncbi:putative 3'-5' exonuclease similar to PolB exonuclease domain [Azospirillum brasilense]|uniref:Putative 3'-5' exonuclease similar to PolB exonuclease domain n=1 Tax=Azospirillum brasilense TaxID=192 RepID=A0A560CK24_AZOBR|nr:3'-5' exonuclease [Azospirillum brasilense]TWA85157.1 putative 3'-5' exonuclease similar to PolB exonuclease domain [Azospirillum brasilense]
MHHDSLLCVDTETMPDRQILPANWPAEKFPPPRCHQIVAISFVEAAINRTSGVEHHRVTERRLGSDLGYDEERLIHGFWSHFARTLPRVTWKGHGFDLPMLRPRAMTYGVIIPAWFQRGDKWTGHTQRYQPDFRCDLLEQIADYGAAQRIDLQAIVDLIRLPGKIGGHGSEVAGMLARGKLGKGWAYRESDVLMLYTAYVRWALLTGRTDLAGHNTSNDSLAECLVRKRASRAHLDDFPGQVTGITPAITDAGADCRSAASRKRERHLTRATHNVQKLSNPSWVRQEGTRES